MSFDPHPPRDAQVDELREAARRQAEGLSGWLVAVAGSLVAVTVIAALVLLDYTFQQDPHRVVKIVAGAAVVVGVLTKPRFGLLLLPIVTPFLPWLPVLPVPGLNPLNMLMFSVFSGFALQRVRRRESVLRQGPIGRVLMLLLGLIALSVVRGLAVPTGYGYDGNEAGVQVFRAVMTFSTYFVALSMTRGAKDRRSLAWAVVLGLLAESIVTIVYGRTGGGGRAEGSIGQSNELGAFLAMFTAFAIALLPATRRWAGRVVLAGAVVCGTFATILTVSRGGLLALTLALGYAVFRSSRLLTVLLLVALVTSPWWIPDYVVERITGTQVESAGTDEEQLEGSAQARIDTWRAIADVITGHPLDGVGYCGLGYVLPDTGDALGLEVKDSAHNTYLRMLAELGIVGLITFLVLLWRCWKLGIEGARLARDPFDRQIAVGVSAATLAMAVSCAFGDRFLSILITGNFWILCALVSDALLERRAEAA